MHNLARIAVGVIAAALLAGCGQGGSSANPTGPTPAPPATSQSVAKLPYGGAPPVTTPLQVAAQQKAHPCKLLTTGDVAHTGISAKPHEYQGHEGMRCDWVDSPYEMGVWWNTSGTGLSGTYGQDKGNSGFKKIADIDSFPAVDDPDPSDNLSCSVVVGLANDLSFAATATVGKDASAACPAAADVAKRVIKNLKSGIGK